jgi:hypothetical protein
MSNDKNKKENKQKKKSQPLLTFQTHDQCHQIRSIMHGEFTKLNSQYMKRRRIKSDKK